MEELTKTRLNLWLQGNWNKRLLIEAAQLSTLEQQVRESVTTLQAMKQQELIRKQTAATTYASEQQALEQKHSAEIQALILKEKQVSEAQTKINQQFQQETIGLLNSEILLIKAQQEHKLAEAKKQNQNLEREVQKIQFELSQLIEQNKEQDAALVEQLGEPSMSIRVTFDETISPFLDPNLSQDKKIKKAYPNRNTSLKKLAHEILKERLPATAVGLNLQINGSGCTDKCICTAILNGNRDEDRGQDVQLQTVVINGIKQRKLLTTVYYLCELHEENRIELTTDESSIDDCPLVRVKVTKLE